MKQIILASSNPIKLEAVRNGFLRMFPGEHLSFIPLSVQTEVSAQPLTDEETLEGAIQRAQKAFSLVPAANYWVGIEGGIDVQGGQMAAFAWVYILSQNKVGKGRTGTFFLPPAVAELIRLGKELGEADDIVFNLKNSKQDVGAVGILTGGVINRSQLYEHAVVLALIPFKNETMYIE